MRIIIDIGHPGHVHYFKNFYKIMTSKGHKILCIAREREVTNSLLKYYNIPFMSRGKGKDSTLGKLTYMLYADYLILSKSLKFKPDIFLSFSSPYAAQISSILRKPHIAINDTEHTDKMHNRFTYPFSEVLITPATYENNLGKKHIKLNCVIESLYLHPKLYQPDSSIRALLGVNQDEEYVIFRFVSWNAFHDVNQGGLSRDHKSAILNFIKRKYKVFISTERAIDKEFEPYKINIPPYRMHDALAYAAFVIAESGTMSSESAILGTPVIYINSLPLMCYLKLEQESGILKHFTNGDRVIDSIETMIATQDLKEKTKKKRDLMTNAFINPTEFLTWFVENYPNSYKIMKQNPDYQYNFK